jgi:predicted amidohydrolase
MYIYLYAAYWEVLLRARAIEYVLESAQVENSEVEACYENKPMRMLPDVHCTLYLWAPQAGRNNVKRESYGHAIIIDPWGKVLADAGGDASPTIICADIGRSHVHSGQHLNKKWTCLPPLE